MSLDTLRDTDDKRIQLNNLATSRNPALFDLAQAYIADAGEAREFKLMANLKLDLAGYYYSILSDHKKAKSLCEEVLPEVEKWQNSYLLANVYKRIGSYSYYLSDYSCAGQHYNKARHLLEEMNDKTREEELELADIYYNLSVVYRTDQYNDYRIEMNNKALEIFLRYREMTRVGRSYNLIGNILLDSDKHEEALQHYLQAIEVFEKTENPSDTNITYSYNNIGSCYTKMKEFDKALSYLGKSLGIRQAKGNPNEVGVALMLTGMTYYEQGTLDESEQYFLQAIEIFQQTGNTYDLLHTTLQIANLYKLKQNYKSACEYLDRHLMIQNELNSESKRRAIADALAESKMEQKEAEAKLLRQKNAEIEEFAKKLQVSNSELKQFAHIVSHDLKEPLRMISSYIEILHARNHIKENPEAKQFIQFITEGTQRMTNLIHELLEYSKVGASYKLQPTDLNEVLKIAALNLGGVLNAKNGIIETHALPVIETDKTMMMQLFQNLLGNGLKYNTSATPVVGVKCVQRDKEIELHFYDNGMGVAAEYREKIFEIFKRLPNSKDIQGTGIGLSICCKVTAQLKGRIWIEPNTPCGSVFKVLLPQ